MSIEDIVGKGPGEIKDLAYDDIILIMDTPGEDDWENIPGEKPKKMPKVDVEYEDGPPQRRKQPQPGEGDSGEPQGGKDNRGGDRGRGDKGKPGLQVGDIVKIKGMPGKRGIITEITPDGRYKVDEVELEPGDAGVTEALLLLEFRRTGNFLGEFSKDELEKDADNTPGGGEPGGGEPGGGEPGGGEPGGGEPGGGEPGGEGEGGEGGRGIPQEEKEQRSPGILKDFFDELNKRKIIIQKEMEEDEQQGEKGEGEGGGDGRDGGGGGDSYPGNYRGAKFGETNDPVTDEEMKRAIKDLIDKALSEKKGEEYNDEVQELLDNIGLQDITDLYSPKLTQDWKDRITRFMRMALGKDVKTDYNVVNPRLGDEALGREVEINKIKDIVIALDVSTSMGVEKFKKALLHINAVIINQKVRRATYHILAWAWQDPGRVMKTYRKVRNATQVKQQIFDLKSYGQVGHTNIFGLFSILARKVRRPDMIIILSDVEINNDYGDEQTARRYIRKNRNRILWVVPQKFERSFLSIYDPQALAGGAAKSRVVRMPK